MAAGSWTLMRNCGVAIVLAMGTSLVTSASAENYHVIYSFCSLEKCADGASGSAPLVVDKSNRLYGVTGGGGLGSGVIFELDRKQRTWTEKVLYGFCPQGQGKCFDGSDPNSLIADTSGNLYGTTAGGGPPGPDAGSVFELVRAHGQWTLRTLYLFCPNGTPCVDGDNPQGLTYAGAAMGLPYDGHSPLFGTTLSGGAGRQGGVVFELKHANGSWKEKVLYSFCSLQGCSDGATPYAGVMVAPSGVLYGTTITGGSGGGGVLYQLSQLDKRDWSEAVLYPFCSQANCSDGYFPESVPITDSAGNLYGTTAYGGTNCNGDAPCGVAFEYSVGGIESTVHDFCSAGNCSDGTSPSAGLIMDSNGALYGTTRYGGAHGSETAGGTVFEVHDGTFQVLYNFCTDQLQCTDGSEPGALTMDSAGNLFGMTMEGGANNFTSGVVFELTP